FEAGSFNMESNRTLLADYGDAASFEKVLSERGQEIAAVFLEGVQGAGGMRPAPAEFFRRVHQAARNCGALFVLDEVISLRLGVGGQQANLGIEADLTMLGKLIGGGFPVGAVGGKKEIMKIFNPQHLKVWHSGTFNANPITMAAGNIAVRELTAERIEKMDRLGARLKAGLISNARQLNIPFSVNHIGSLLNVFFM